MKRNSDKTKLVIAMAIFGTIGLVRKYIPYPSSVVALVRGLVGVAFLLLVHFLRRERFNAPAIRKNAVILLVSGVLIGANWIFLFEAYRYTSVSVATVCYYMAPVFVMLASPIVLKEALTLRKGLCALAAVAGMVMVSGVIETGVTGLTGVALGLGAAVMYAVVILLNKFIVGLTANERTIFQLGFATVALLPYVLLTESVTSLDIGGSIVIMLLIAGVVNTGIAYTLYFGSIETLSAQTVAIFSYIDPVVAVILSVVVLKEPISALSVAGAALVLGATLFSELEPVKKAAAAE